MVLVVPPVYYLEIPKGDVADGYIEKTVRHLHLSLIHIYSFNNSFGERESDFLNSKYLSLIHI